MAIGTIKLQGTPQQYSSPSVSPNAFGAGVAVALKGLGGDLKQVEDAAELRRSNTERFATDTEWARIQGDWNRDQLDTIQNAPETGEGITNARYDSLEAKRQEFLGTLSPAMRERMSATTQIAVENLTTNTYQAEFELGNAYETREISDTINGAAGEIIAGRASVEGAMELAGTIITSSNLSDAAKAIALDAAETDLLSAQFHRDIVNVQTSMGPTRDWQDGEVVAAGMSPTEVGMLNAIASEESAGSYSVRWSGPGNTPQHFTDFSGHPRIFVDNGHGDVSSAAGRYQITASTWDSLPARFRQGGFTPANQDRAALYLAEQRYNQAISPGERSFNEIINNGSDADLLLVRDTLAPTWAAFKHMKDDKFLNIFRGSQGQAGRGTGSSTAPDPFTDPRYANLPVATRLQMQADAAQAAAGVIQQQQAELTATAEALKAELAMGNPNAPMMIDQAIANGDVPIDQIPSLRALNKEDREAAAAGVQFGVDMSNSVRMGDTKENQDAAFRFMRDTGMFAGVQQESPEAAESLAMTFGMSGVMPQEMSDLLTSMTQSANPSTMAYGMGILAGMRDKARGQFDAALPADLVEATNAWSVINRYSDASNPSSAVSRMMDWNNPEQREMRAALAEESQAEFDKWSTQDIVDEFSSFVGNTLTPNANLYQPIAPASLSRFNNDAQTLFNEYYPLFQDSKQTMEFVQEQMSYSWSQDDSSGVNRLMYLAPSSPAAGLPRLEGRTDWVDEDVRFAMDFDVDTNYALLADEQTAGAISRGEAANYGITRVMDNGTTQVIMDEETGLPKRLSPTISPEIEANQQRRAVLRGIDARIEDLDRELGLTKNRLEYVGNVYGLDSFEVLDQIEVSAQASVRLEQARGERREYASGVSDSYEIASMRNELAELKEPRTPGTSGAIAAGVAEVANTLNSYGPDGTTRESRIAELERKLRVLGITEEGDN